MTSANHDGEEFAKCMSKTTKKIEKEHKMLIFKLQFLQYQTLECFDLNKTKKAENYSVCEEKAMETL